MNYGIAWWLILALSIIPYTPLYVGLIKQNDKSHTFFTWVLYLILDCLTMFSGEKERIEMDPMVFGFAIGSLIMASILAYQKKFVSWTLLETIIIALIIICTILWFLFGSYIALISSIASETIVGIYLIIQTFKYPKIKYNLVGYLGFLIVSILSVIFTKNWSFEEIGFAISETMINIVILIPLFLKKWRYRQYKLRK